MLSHNRDLLSGFPYFLPSMLKEKVSTDLSTRQFEKVKQYLYKFSGIKLNNDKQSLVKSRLTRRLYALGLESFEHYLSLVDKDSAEFLRMIDALTTNKTNFFREIAHFDFLKDRVLPGLKERKLRIWSAACSSGEEPYSIGMLLCERLPDIARWDIKILATDISPTILDKAKVAEYSDEAMSGITAAIRQKYFVQKSEKTFRIHDRVRKLISFANLNLMQHWPMRGPFDVIFCRNVMIYFDKQTQSVLVNRLYDLIADGGYLFVGHSESLTGVSHKLKYIQPATFLK